MRTMKKKKGARGRPLKMGVPGRSARALDDVVTEVGLDHAGGLADVHTEGGGPDGAVVLYSVRGHGENDLIELMDEDQNVLAVIGWKELAADA